jgi:hypothetical protein
VLACMRPGMDMGIQRYRFAVACSAAVRVAGGSAGERSQHCDHRAVREGERIFGHGDHLLHRARLPRAGLELERCAVIGPPHVGALKEPAAFEKAAAKDRSKGWVRHGYRLPPVWPMRADPMNIVMRNDKGRMTIDKSMQLIQGVAAYNDCVVSISRTSRPSSTSPSRCWGGRLPYY